MAASIDPSRNEGTTVSFAQTPAALARFKSLFAEGMALVEEAATYLDGPGRLEAATLRPGLRGAYSAESMRLTTRLMQVASWLLIRRAVLDGEMPSPAEGERGRIALSAQQPVSTPQVMAELPDTLQQLTGRSLRLQARIQHLDRMVNGIVEETAAEPEASGLQLQLARLRAAFEKG